MKVRVASHPDPLWETMLSLFRLRQRDAPLVFGRWRRRAAPRARAGDLALLDALVPRGYFPDFLTPAEGSLGFDAGIEALLATPRSRLRGDLSILAAQQGALPSWTRPLADGDPRALEQLAAAIRSHHAAVIAPFWPEAQVHIDADRAKRARAFHHGGCEGLLRSYRPMMRWKPPVLEVDRPLNQTLHLAGRGLLLVPSYLCWHHPDVLRDPALPPVLVYPVEHDLVLSAAPHDREGSLRSLMGNTRAAVLEAADGRTNSELARHVGISAAAASVHATVLREAGLISTRRAGKAVVHSLTPLGVALLEATSRA